MPHQGRSMVASVQFHVQQWINLVLYNSIYQNQILLYLYRAFKFLFGLISSSTELSRICSAYSPLDRLWDTDDGHPVSALIHDKHGGTLAYTTASPSIVSVVAGRRGSVQMSVHSGTTTTSSTAGSPALTGGLGGGVTTDDNGSTTIVGGSDSARTSSDSSTAASLTTSDMEKQDDIRDGLRQRQKRRESSSPLFANNKTIKMDLRQAKTAAEMIYRIGMNSVRS
ncbi:hypothetical protein BGZ94_009844 [Podila epigama]|nr:hypothetical protein BGZ94_009844 [Podila epigama]